MAKHLIFMGAPGSGKGTQAEKLVKEHGFNHISTGNLLRAEVAKGTELGQKVDAVLKAGQLVSDDLMKSLLEANVDKNVSTIFDGYPRNIDQAHVLDEVLGDSDYQALFFDVNVEDLVERLTHRVTCNDCGAIYNLKSHPPKKEGVCDNCGGTNLFQRADDKEEVIRDRQKVYKESTAPVLAHYKESGKLAEIDANRPIDEIYKEVLELI